MTTSADFHSFALGRNRAWILRDGTFLMPATAIARGATPAQLAAVLGDALRPDGQMKLSVNVPLVQWGRELILFDAGCGTAYGPSLGRKDESLNAAGFTPEDITAVVFTHLHLDHIAGALEPNRQRLRYPNARWFAVRDEWEFWRQLSPPLGKSAVPPDQQASIVRSIQEVLGVLAPVIELMHDGVTPFEGITMKSLPGHTPHHCGYLLNDDEHPFLIMGDALSDPRLHVPHPEWAQVGDADPDLASATRRALVKEAAALNLDVFGCHFPFPGRGRIQFAGRENLSEKTHAPLAPYFKPSN